jgi:gamma-glutamylcyclotransferase (GGCT)/AIG2-like uncharacterized protein YtfP
MDIGTTNKLAVYGTLKKNFGNHHYLNNSKFIGEGTTKEMFTLSVKGIPFVSKEPTSHIHVEVYDVNKEDFPAIDGLEGHPDWYVREKTTIIVNGEEIEAWLYFYPEVVGTINYEGKY